MIKYDEIDDRTKNNINTINTRLTGYMGEYLLRMVCI